MDLLNSMGDSAFFNPAIAVLSALILTGTSSLSYDFKLPILIFFMGITLILICNSLIYVWLRTMIFIFAWAIIVALPIPFMTPGEILIAIPLGPIQLTASNIGVYLMAGFILRVIASATIFSSFIFIMGWKRIIMGLETLHFPRELIILLKLSVVYIPLFLREASKMLLAREARIMRKMPLREIWKISATVVGDLLLRSHQHAWRIGKAIKARSFTMDFPGPPSAPIRARDLFLLLFTLLLLLLKISYGL